MEKTLKQGAYMRRASLADADTTVQPDTVNTAAPADLYSRVIGWEGVEQKQEHVVGLLEEAARLAAPLDAELYESDPERFRQNAEQVYTLTGRTKPHVVALDTLIKSDYVLMGWTRRVWLWFWSFFLYGAQHLRDGERIRRGKRKVLLEACGKYSSLIDQYEEQIYEAKNHRALERQKEILADDIRYQKLLEDMNRVTQDIESLSSGNYEKERRLQAEFDSLERRRTRMEANALTKAEAELRGNGRNQK